MSRLMRPPEGADWQTLLPDLLPAGDATPLPAGLAADPDRLLAYLTGSKLLTAYQADKLRRGQGRALVVGPYRLLCPLARGGMGMVYLAAGPDGGPVAVKLLAPARAAREPKLVGRFRREQMVGARLPAHPHLVRQLDFGTDRGVEFLVLNHLPGRTVRQRLAMGPLPVGAACRVFADAAAGLAAAHAAGVVHRDLKPGNVMVGPTGRGTVIDFGLALVAGEPVTDWRLVGGPRVTVGTLDYMPPEQAADAARVTPAADLYALGGSLLTALTGRLPFEAAGVTAKLAALRTLPPPAVAEFRPDVPKSLNDLVARLLAKRPGERPGSAAAVAAELERWADRGSGDPVPDRPPLAAVIAEAEAEWAGRVGPSDTDQATAMVAVPAARPAVVLSRRRAWRLAAGVGAATALAVLLGYALAGG